MPYSRSEYLALPSPAAVWIWRGLLPTSGSALLFGEPKAGKSYIALGLAEAIANSRMPNFLGQPLEQHGRVLYVQLDTPRSLWKANYVAKTGPGDDLFIVDREEPSLPAEFDIRRSEHQDWLRAQVDAVQPVAVVADTIRNCHAGDENDSLVMRLVGESLRRATQPAALLMLSHQRKPGTGGDSGSSVSSARGSSALTGAVDAILHLGKKRLTVSARSDVAHEIRVHQTDSGFFVGEDDESRVRTFLAGVDPAMGSRAIDMALAKEFGVTDRTARTWRTKLSASKS